MQKLKFILVMLLCFASFTCVAATKKYNNGEVTAHLSGNRAEIVDNVKNVCIVVKVSRQKSSAGEWLYEFACNNKTTKRLTLLALHEAIKVGVSTVASPLGAAAISGVATIVADDIYDSICEYYRD